MCRLYDACQMWIFNDIIADTERCTLVSQVYRASHCVYLCVFLFDHTGSGSALVSVRSQEPTNSLCRHISVNPCQNGPFLAPPMQNANNFECPCSAFSPADPKIVSENTNKISKSQQLTDTTHTHYTTEHFYFQRFRSADKFDEDDALASHPPQGSFNPWPSLDSLKR